MNGQDGKAAPQLEQATGDTIAHNFWIAFNDIGLYGPNHPLTGQALGTLVDALSGCLTTHAGVSLHVHQQELFCDDLRIDLRNFGKRLLDRMSDAGIESITFSAGVHHNEILALIDMLHGVREYRDVNSMAQDLQKKGVTHVRLNTIRYQKIAEGQIVVDESVGKVAQRLGPGPAAPLDPQTLARLAAVAPSGDSTLAATIAARVRELRDRVDAEMSSTPASSDEIVTALSSLNKDIAEQLRIERSSGSIMQAHEEALGQAEELTFDTLVRIVREEYQSGEISVERLAQIVRRLIPDVADLKRLLPRLKQGLLEAGMQQKDYLKLMEELAGEFEQEGLTVLLEGASREAGIRVREVLDDIKKNPEAVVQLTLLSAEIQSMIGLDSAQLRKLMGEYIDRMTTELLLKGRNDGMARNIGAMQEALSHVQESLMNRIAEGGADPDSIKQAGVELARLVNEGIARIKSAAPTPAAPSEPQQPPVEEKIQPLPKGVLSSKGIKVFLDREIKRHRRYKTPLSCLCMSAFTPKQPSGCQEPDSAVLQEALQALCDTMGKTLRDLDLIGSLGSLGDNLLLVILSMTDEAGANAVKKRLTGMFEQLHVVAGSATITPVVLMTISPLDLNATPDLDSYVKHMITHHRSRTKEILGP